MEALRATIPTAVLPVAADLGPGGEVATFEEWVRAALDHPASVPEWYWCDTFDAEWDALGLDEQHTVGFLGRLFRGPEVLKPYSLPQVGQAIWFLVGEGSPAQVCHALLSSAVPLAERTDVVRATSHFFRAFVAPAAPGEARENDDPFHTACYMWWDIFPARPGSGAEPEIHRACLDAMLETLALPSELCQLSALHGFNHWQPAYPNEVATAIDGFLRRQPPISPRIRSYAEGARTGGLQ